MLPLDKLRSLTRRHEEVEELLCDPAVLSDPRKLNTLNRERGQLVPIVEAMSRLDAIDRRIAEDREALDDPELGPLAREEIQSLEQDKLEVESRLRILLLPRDPNDDKNTILEIRGGTGGEEAALFAADLFRMFARYAERRGWRVEVLSTSEAAAGGIKELIALVSGDRVYSRLKHEGGVHRVQRVPQTEAQGRIHTSTATVAVLPEAEDVDLVIDERDLKVDIPAVRASTPPTAPSRSRTSRAGSWSSARTSAASSRTGRRR
jgi:peptide chain release factor 1